MYVRNILEHISNHFHGMFIYFSAKKSPFFVRDHGNVFPKFSKLKFDK